uniref:ANKLE2 third alpha/beta domain-containing protein n=2 Tax=Anopheles funestus TaxID=62324 RepID=A0A182RKS2_ANOFN
MPQEGVMYDITYDSSFIQAILAGDFRKVWLMIISVPTLLINDMSHPRVYNARGETALHIAARVGSVEICTCILEAVSSTMFVASYQGHQTPMTYAMSEKLLDLYLNSPERHNYDTPLHLAAQCGWSCIVRLLVSYPQCEIKRNKWGLLPQDIVCVRATRANGTRAIRATITGMIEDSYFVPLIRTESDLEPPHIGEPFTRRNPPGLMDRTGDKLAPRQRITAFAGPMTHAQAVQFRKMWQKPPRLIIIATKKQNTPTGSWYTDHNQSYVCSISCKIFDKTNMTESAGYVMRDFRKSNLTTGMERLGRQIARGVNVQWREYWPFLRVYCDLAEPFGLQLFEMYLAERVRTTEGELSTNSIAIGGDIRSAENVYALFAIKHVEVDGSIYPYVNLWKHSIQYLLSMA